MENDTTFLMIDIKVLPEVFLKVLEVKRMLDSGEVKNVQEAAKKVNVSRSAYYKYKDSIFPIYENLRGRTITISLSIDNTLGVLSNILNVIANESANILTINQNIPINNIANVTITIETGLMQKNLNDLINKINEIKGVNNLKIIARE